MVYAVRQRRRKILINGTACENSNGETGADMENYRSGKIPYRTKKRAAKRPSVLLLLASIVICSFGTKLIFGLFRPQRTTRKLMHKNTVFLFENDFPSKPMHIVRHDSNSSSTEIEEGDDASLQHPLEYFETEDCKLTQEWQKKSFPSCNSLHETNLQIARYVASGGVNDVWEVTDEITGVPLALKTMQLEYNRTVHMLWSWNKDALVLERLTSSPYISTIYGFCGTSSVQEYSYYPDLASQIYQQRDNGGYPGDIDSTQLLRIAVDVARSVAEVHTFEGEERATVGHGDLNCNQFIYMDGVYKLNDFDWAFFLRWNDKLKEVCPVKDNHLILQSAPEEKSEEGRTEKADVYSMGVVLWCILTGRDIYVDKGVPQIPHQFHVSKDPVHIALLEAMDRCWKHSPRRRASAKEIAEDLSIALRKIEQDRQSFDGKRWKISI